MTADAPQEEYYQPDEELVEGVAMALFTGIMYGGTEEEWHTPSPSGWGKSDYSRRMYLRNVALDAIRAVHAQNRLIL